MRDALEERHIELPPVFRYLSQEYIHEFFSSGRLRLSAFSEFAKHTDEQRLDTEEGWIVVTITGQTKKLRSRVGRGRDAYILSTSLRGDTELMRVFATDGYFKINDLVGFYSAVSDRIPNCITGRIGCCIYLAQRKVQRKMGVAVDEAVKMNEQGKMNLMRVMEVIGAATFPDIYFWKLGQYAHQQEVRFVWDIGDRVNGPLSVECPEAVQFCERIT
jgi:hypothetical protein